MTPRDLAPHSDASPKTPRRRAISSLLVVSLGLSLTGFVCRWAWLDSINQDRERFAVQVETARQAFDTETEKYEQAINGVREWMGWLEIPSQAEWANKLERMDLPLTFPGLARIGYAPWTGQMTRWQGRVPEHWSKIWPDGYLPETRDRLAYEARPVNWTQWSSDPVIMYAPGEGDVYSGAYHSGSLRTTRRIFIQGPDGSRMAAYRAYMAVYADETLPAPRSEETKRDLRRMNSFIGAVIAEVAIEPLLRQVWNNPELEVELYSGPIAETNRMNRLSLPAYASSHEYATGLHQNYEVPWYGQRWTLACRPTSAFYLHSNRSRVWWVGTAGLLLTAAMAGTVWIEGTGRSKAEELSAELVRARDDLRAVQVARTQLQRNLHDAVLQRLYVAALHARKTWQSASRGGPVLTDELANQVAELDSAMVELRSFLGGPIQNELSDKDLATTLGGLAQAFSRQTGVGVRLTADAKVLGIFPSESRQHLLPIIREGLSNAWRHGRATSVEISIAEVGQALVLTLTDDGIGFDAVATDHGGHGLKNLLERTAQCGGRFHVDSRPGGPTTLRMEWSRSKPHSPTEEQS